MLTLFIIFELLLLFGMGAALEYGAAVWNFFCTVIAVTIAFLFFQTNPLDFVAHHWSDLILLFVGWFVVGGIVSIVKWMTFVRRPANVAKIKEAYADWQETVKHTPKTADKKFEDYYDNPLKLDKHVGRILAWIVYWPTVVLWALTYRLVETVTRAIYNSLKGVLTSIANRQVDKVVSSK